MIGNGGDVIAILMLGLVILAGLIEGKVMTPPIGQSVDRETQPKAFWAVIVFYGTLLTLVAYMLARDIMVGL